MQQKFRGTALQLKGTVTSDGAPRLSASSSTQLSILSQSLHTYSQSKT